MGNPQCLEIGEGLKLLACPVHSLSILFKSAFWNDPRGRDFAISSGKQL